ncbi:MAG: polysaccharide deacetylase family protein [Akkermansiaceae bacterium]|nr:polysaccharide deacetylase family protein [Akkermansiaceae bacterium]MCF7734259.1 polysaccharide deacetylase family protein [Akkermansiaceae bacterium]
MKHPMIAATTRLTIFLAAISLPSQAAGIATEDPDPYGILIKPIPEKTVVLSFDDGVASHATNVAPILKKLGFGGSFYICDFDGFNTRKDWYMTWPQIKSLSDDGFDVGNHTKGHGGASMDSWLGMEAEFSANGIPKPTTLCWPVYAVYEPLYPDLLANHYTFGRAGGDRPYRPSMDHPLNVPSFSLGDGTSMERFISQVQLATRGKIVVFTIHGVPEGEHMAVSLDPAKFARMMEYLKENDYHVISMRDLGEHVDAAKAAKFLPFPRRLAWGGMTREDKRLYVSISKLPADRKVTLPGMTTRIASAWFLDDSKKRPLKITRADTGIQTIAVPESSFVATADFPTVIAAELQGGPIATLLEFGFTGAPEGTISGNEIRVKVPLATDLTKLVPRYNTGSPQVTGKPASGTPNDFTRPQTYTITAADGSSRRYVVTVTPTPGAVAVTNPSFERFDSSGPYDTRMESNPSGATWSFKKPGNQGELGIRDLVKSPSAPLPPDGTRHSVVMRGTGNGISQEMTFDQGKYTVSLDAVKRRGYEKSAAPLIVTIDGVPVLSLASSQITENWASYTSPVIPVTAGVHTLAITLGEGDGMDLIDNVAINHAN